MFKFMCVRGAYHDVSFYHVILGMELGPSPCSSLPETNYCVSEIEVITVNMGVKHTVAYLQELTNSYCSF